MGILFTRLVSADGNPVYPGSILIQAIGAPVSHGGGLVADGTITAQSDVTGFVSQTLLGGRYRIWIGKSDPRSFVMPSADGTFLLEDLLGVDSGYVALNYRYAGVVLQLLNGTTGGWHTIRIAGATVPELRIGLQDEDLTGQNWQWDDTTLHLRNADAAEWQQIYLVGSSPQIAIATTANPVANNARLSAGRLQFRNVTTGLYHTLYITGSGSPSIAIGAGEA